MTVKPQTVKAKNRKAEILTAALVVAEQRGGWSSLTREAVARQAVCADGLVSRYFGTMSNFRRAIMRAAIVRVNLSVLAQGIASGDKCALKAPPALQTQALQTLSRG